jgi:hypothetical protein
VIITAIEIKNVKGFEHQKFDLRLLPNKPNLLVAPNGFGKTSFATAFASMNRNRMTLDDNDCYKCDNQNQPELTLTIEDNSHSAQILTANDNQNDIRKQFDITVIRSGLTPKATRTYMGGVSASLEIQPIPICKISPKATFAYQYSMAKSAFGANGKVLPNITEQLKHVSICDAIAQSDLSKTQGKRIQKSIAGIKEQINQQDGSSDNIRQWINDNLLDDLKGIDHLNTLAQAISDIESFNSDTEVFLAALQIIEIYKSDTKAFDAAVAWLRYTEIKRYYDELLEGFCSSDWQWAELNEDKKHKTLSVTFPQAHQISNGQRDIVTLVVQMHKALYAGASKPLILVIDEVFDYLDDANLIAFQYYVTSLIEQYKKREQVLYPLILTHLDPGVFFDFCFNKHKIQTHYLQPHLSGKSQNTIKLIEAREKEDAIKSELEKHWFHHHPDDCQIKSSEWPKGLPDDWRNSGTFHSYTTDELQRYLEGKNYDPLAVCFAIRITIECKVYSLLDGQSKASFINTHKTREKLRYAAARVEDIPETFFLLGLIYNTSLHWKQDRDYISPLVAKLSHPTIKNLIHSVAVEEDY